MASTRYGAIPLMLGEGTTPEVAKKLASLQKPLASADRILIGRALWAAEEPLRAAAAEAIARCVALGSFSESLRLLLRPGVCSNSQDVVTAIGKSCEPCPPLERALQWIASDAVRFNQVTRSAAGLAIATRAKRKNDVS